MKKNFAVLFFAVVLQVSRSHSQTPSVEVLTSGTKTSLRGLSVVNDNVIWVSGSNGTVGKSSNGGRNWKWLTVKGFEKTDFRDIEAFDASTAIIMGIAEPAYILKTTDGGETWKVVYENKTKGMFLDAMEFWNEESGIVIGDPVNGRFFITRTFDGGSTWQDIPFDKRPKADSGEACFAASGTNVRVLDKDEAVFVSGGLKSRLYKRDDVIELPLIIQGKETTGANSVSVWDDGKRKGGKKMIIAGGDFNADSSNNKNCAITRDGGKTWQAPATPPHGYRSCVEFVSEKDVFSCGLNGVDYTANGGKDWQWISKEGFHVCRIAKRGTSIFLAGSNGKIGKIVWK
ncbi:MAG: oxidoreductase [Sphingobacteriales bacterium]|nr:oxidoreductase [Sphingobacteriales bacterium]